MQGNMCNKNNRCIAQVGRNEKATMYFLIKSFQVEAIQAESWHKNIATFKLFNLIYRSIYNIIIAEV